MGLDSFVSLSDAHIGATLHSLEAFAASSQARSGSWSEVAGALKTATQGNVALTVFYALPNGRYWTLAKGLQPVPIDDRPYFATVFSGKNAIGDLVIGRSAGTKAAIVAVPVRNASGKVIALVGAGIDLEKLSAMLAREMGVGPGIVFWATDSHGITALHSATENVMNNALKDPTVGKVLAHMIATPSGLETYTFKGKTRTVLYRHSALTGWTYGFGVVH